MTVATATTNRVSEVGNGVKVAFDFSFRIFAASELQVFKVVTATGAQTLQTITTDYSVAINGVDNALTTPGGTVTYVSAPLATETSLIISSYTLDQQSRFPTAGNFPEIVVEDAVDKLTLIAIQLNEEIGRSAKLPEATTLTDLSLPLPTANKALLWNASANALINSTDDFNDIVTNATTQANNAASSASSASSSASAAATSESNAASSASAAATSASEAQAAVGGVRISADDTTADNLEAKLLVGTGLDLTTQNPGGNETRTISLDVNELTDTVITASDEIMFADVSDSNNIKKDTVQGILDLTPGGSRRNLLIGGDFTINPFQRGTSFTSATTPANNDDTYLADRWILLSDGNDTVDVSQDTDGSLLLDVETSNRKFGILQVLDNNHSRQAVDAGTVSLRFDIKGAGINNIRAAVLAWDSTADTVTSDVVSAWNAVGVDPTFATNWTAENTPSNITPGGSFSEHVIENISLDTSGTNNIAVFMWVDDTNASAGFDTLNIRRIQLNIGSTAAPFEFRDFTTELLMARRYYQEFDFSATSTGVASGFANTTSQATIPMMFNQMRAAPTVSTSSDTHFDIFHSNTNNAITSFAFNNVTNNSMRVVGTVAGTPLTVGHGIGLMSNNVLAKLIFDAEL